LPKELTCWRSLDVVLSSSNQLLTLPVCMPNSPTTPPHPQKKSEPLSCTNHHWRKAQWGRHAPTTSAHWSIFPLCTLYLLEVAGTEKEALSQNSMQQQSMQNRLISMDGLLTSKWFSKRCNCISKWPKSLGNVHQPYECCQIKSHP
jgi:hypothetical protein